MANTALNRTTQALLTNKSGGNLVYGDVVVLDNTNANGFTTTTTAGLSTRQLGCILEPNGIANNASGMVAVGGWAPRANLNTAATIGQFIKTHTVAGQGTPHNSPQVEGDFAVALTASANPAILLFGSPNGPLTGGTGTVTNTGTLTSGKAIIGNGTVDVTVSAASGVAHLASGALTGSNVLLASEVTGVLPGTQGGGLVLLEQHTASSSPSLNFTTCITSAYDIYLVKMVSLVPASNGQGLQLLASTNGGSSYDTGSNYNWQGFSFHGTSTAATTGGDGASALISVDGQFGVNGVSNTSTLPLAGDIWIYDPLSTSVSTYFEGRVRFKESTGGVPLNNFLNATYIPTTAMNAFQLIMTAGNIASGTARVFGLAK